MAKEHDISLIVNIMSVFISIRSSPSMRSSKIFLLFLLSITIYTTNSFTRKQLKHISRIKTSSLLSDFLTEESPKERLLSTIDGSVNKLLVSPESLSDLKEINRFYGFAQESYLYDNKYNKKYNILKDKYIDLTIKSETDAPVWSIGFNELIGQLYVRYVYICVYVNKCICLGYISVFLCIYLYAYTYTYTVLTSVIILTDY